MTLVKVNHPAAKTFDGLMNDLFNDLPAHFGKTFREDVLTFPPVNILEDSNAYELRFSVAGFDKSDFQIKLENNILTISAEKKDVATTEGQKLVRKEFSQKAFKRSFTLDEKIESANIEAKYENGILTLLLPKKEVAKVVTKEISIK